MATDLREFVADDLWLLIGIVTFAAISLLGMLGLDSVTGFVAVVGWFLLTPVFLFWGDEIAALLFDADRSGGRQRETRSRNTDHGTDEDDAIAELKRRYAEGEIDDAEFERRLERLVGVEEALETVFPDRRGEGDGERERRKGTRDRSGEGERERGPERERERDLEG
ncbi:hypothetical protein CHINAEXTREME_08230 [Halobiforma lacisalsi AJ5]|uniref:SHOCT domain-containing protein n=1 Tax=Natronobacterium lacisalsi AJ5 TaxID=358396 RepID=M0LVL6_NATLA|nr:SHOCT domain-containing protein [Halobiforma lacisalsi]APW97764.1 hypothetical protein CHINAEXTREME_08230 [Halobiforma lacisalsi AJ5]EMA37491.1 hypothetical protein C445_01351 [Halobiforma lacisalsi AJ5]